MESFHLVSECLVKIQVIQHSHLSNGVVLEILKLLLSVKMGSNVLVDLGSAKEDLDQVVSLYFAPDEVMLAVGSLISLVIIVKVYRFHAPFVSNLIVQSVLPFELILIHLKETWLLLIHLMIIKRLMQILLLKISACNSSCCICLNDILMLQQRLLLIEFEFFSHIK